MRAHSKGLETAAVEGSYTADVIIQYWKDVKERRGATEIGSSHYQHVMQFVAAASTPLY